MKLNSIISTIQVTDLDEAIDFYVKIGFEKRWKWPEQEPTHASVGSDGHSIMMAKVNQSHAIQQADLYFTVEGVEGHREMLSQHDLDLSPMVQSAYGMKDFSLVDPWGHHLTFGEPSGEFTG